ncbi:MAG: hypothetical protein WBA61_14640 [Aequorivita sp.]
MLPSACPIPYDAANAKINKASNNNDPTNTVWAKVVTSLISTLKAFNCKYSSLCFK